MPREQKSVKQRHDPLYTQLDVDETQSETWSRITPGETHEAAKIL